MKKTIIGIVLVLILVMIIISVQGNQVIDSCWEIDGTTSLTKGRVVGYTDNTYYVRNDECHDIDSNTLIEWYCDGTTISARPYDCGSGWTCKDGRCVESKPDKCFDTDNGKNPLIKGKVAGYSDNDYYTHTDKCHDINKNTLLEWYCDGSTMSVKAYNCKSGCENGKCLKTQ